MLYLCKILLKFQMNQNPEFPKKSIEEFVKNFKANIEPSKESLIKLLNVIDYTTLDATDTKEKVKQLIAEVKSLEKIDKRLHPAAICTWPNFAENIVKGLKKSKTKAAVVAGCFPAAQAEIASKALEVVLAKEAGVNEIDVVLNPGLIIAGKYSKAFKELKTIRKACGKKVQLKVIIESGALQNLEQVFNASIISLEAGADFIKTSTGKVSVGATPEAFATMLSALHWFNQKNKTNRGIKASGGIRTTQEGLTYLALYEDFMQREASPSTFRIGASSLVANVLNDLNKFGLNLAVNASKNNY
jgi:deoxyribose-phosphate aldolase